MEPLTQSLSQLRRRTRILDAASRLFAAEAFEAVQMDSVAREAKVAKPTLYRYFATKEALFLETLDAMLLALTEATAAAEDPARPPEAALADAVREIVATLARCAAAVRALDGNGHGLGDRGRAIIRQRVQAIRANLSAILRRGRDAGVFRPLDPEVSANAILGAARMTAAHLRPPHDAASASREIVDLLTRGVRA